VAYDDVTYRTFRDSNSTMAKILDPQPPFGIPLGPVSQSSPNDYLHATPPAHPAPNPIPKPKRQQKQPDCVLDDMAFRNLRKDLKDSRNNSPVPPLMRSVKKDGSVDVEGLERLLETVGATSDVGETYSSVEDDCRVDWVVNPSWANRSITPSPLGKGFRPPLATSSKTRLVKSAKHFSSHPDLRKAAVGVGLVNKFFCVMPLPVEKGEQVPKRATTPIGPAKMVADWDKFVNDVELKPAGSVPNLRSTPIDVSHREFLAKFPKKKKLPDVDFGPGPIGAIASLVAQMKKEEEEEEEKALKSVSVSIVDVPASSVTVLSAIRRASLTNQEAPRVVELEVIEPKPIILEENKPKHAEVILSQEWSFKI
jgi:hypothetical protein